jgi:hypothetical protein
MNRLVRLQRQLARVGDVIHDHRIIMYLVKGLRSEYHSITDTWDVHNLRMDTVKRDLRQKGMRIESRAQSHTTEPPTPTPFAASHDDVTTDLLKRQVSELQDQLKSLQGATTTRRTLYGIGAAMVFRGVCYGSGKKGHRTSECPDNSTGGNSAQVDSSVAFPAVMDVTATRARPFSEAQHMFEHDEETWMWLTDSGASHHMTSVRRDFCEYRALTDRLWVNGSSARAVGMGSVRIIVKVDDGDEIPAMLSNVLYVPELSRRASWSYHRLFSLAQARRQGHCVVLADPADHLRFHAGHGGGVVVPLELAHLLVWLPARVASSIPTASVATAPLHKRLWHSRLVHLGESQLDGLLAAHVEGVALSASKKLGFCETCVVCKSHSRRISSEPAGRNVGVVEVLGLDFCGLMSVSSLGGRRYTFCAVDFRSRFMLHDAVHSKDEAPASFRSMLTTVHSLGHTVPRLRVDNDTVFLSAAFRNLLDEFDIAG